MVTIEISSPHSLFTLWDFLVPFGHNTLHGRQTTDRAIGIDRHIVAFRLKIGIVSDSLLRTLSQFEVDK